MKCTNEANTNLPPGILGQLQEKLHSLENALLVQDPDIPSYLKESHKLLISYPETAHLLDDAEIGNLIKAAEQMTKVSIIKEAAKKSSTSRTKVKDVDVDML